jgi:hypothetical protein
VPIVQEPLIDGVKALLVGEPNGHSAGEDTRDRLLRSLTLAPPGVLKVGWPSNYWARWSK